MSKERRIYSRSELPGKVLLNHPSHGEQVLVVRNLSNGGLLLEATLDICPPIGATVEVQFIGLEEKGPVIKVRVIRIDSQGLALSYI